MNNQQRTKFISEILGLHPLAAVPNASFLLVPLKHVLPSDSSTLKLIVRAEAKKGYSPLIGAKIEVQAGTSQWKLMKDDGVGT